MICSTTAKAVPTCEDMGWIAGSQVTDVSQTYLSNISGVTVAGLPGMIGVSYNPGVGAWNSQFLGNWCSSNPVLLPPGYSLKRNDGCQWVTEPTMYDNNGDPILPAKIRRNYCYDTLFPILPEK